MCENLRSLSKVHLIYQCKTGTLNPEAKQSIKPFLNSGKGPIYQKSRCLKQLFSFVNVR